MEQKFCKKCEKLLPITSFTKNANAKDKMSYSCRKCQREYNNPVMRKYREKLRKEKAMKLKSSKDPNDVTHIKLSSFDFDRDYSNTLKFLEKMGYDITHDLHDQFLKRVLMKFGKVLKPKGRPQDNITKYFE